MKTIFIPSKSRERLDKTLFSELSKILPKTLAIYYSVQYEDLAKEIMGLLGKTRKITNFSQVLGCSRVSPKKDTKAVLLIGSGRFHALSIASNTNLPIYIYEHNGLTKVQEKDVQLFKQRGKSAYTRFLSSDRAGVLISTKPGQQKFSRALELKKKLKNKQLYFFLGDLLPVQEFENFGLNSWVNTSCPRLDMDSPSILNIGDLDIRN